MLAGYVAKIASTQDLSWSVRPVTLKGALEKNSPSFPSDPYEWRVFSVGKDEIR